jgi:hypothetical protein
MEHICSQCHAVIDAPALPGACPACGGALIARPVAAETESGGPPREVDHRGIVLPRRHALGGIITPQ